MRSVNKDDAIVSWSQRLAGPHGASHWIRPEGRPGPACGIAIGVDFRMELADEATLCHDCLILMREDHRLRAVALGDGTDLRR